MDDCYKDDFISKTTNYLGSGQNNPVCGAAIALGDGAGAGAV